MESTIRQTNNVKHELDVQLTPSELSPYLEFAYREAQKNASLKGFRRGHVPISMIKKLYGASLEREALEEAAQKEFAKVVEEKEIRPIGTPSITKLDKTDEGGLTFTVAYEVMPSFELGEYKGLQARRIIHNVTDEEVGNELRRIQESYAASEDEQADSVADENHVVTVDLKKVEGNDPAAQNSMSDVRIFLARNDVNPELKSMLLNTKTGDTFRIDLPTGEKGEMTNYEVTVGEIHRMNLPELNDELAVKLIGNDEATIEQLTDYVRQGIQSEYERRYSGFFRDELINTLLEQYQFDVPESFVAEVLKSFIEDMKKGPKKELPKDFNAERFVMENRPMAERTARWALIRDRIIDTEELRADDADYEGLAEIESQRTGIDYDTLLNYFKKSDKIEDRILAEKAIQLLEDYAIVQELDDTELPAETHDHDHDHDHDHAHDHNHDHDHDHGHADVENAEAESQEG
jgi:trigger factor